jgi:hypothetical protein
VRAPTELRLSRGMGDLRCASDSSTGSAWPSAPIRRGARRAAHAAGGVRRLLRCGCGCHRRSSPFHAGLVRCRRRYRWHRLLRLAHSTSAVTWMERSSPPLLAHHRARREGRSRRPASWPGVGPPSSGAAGPITRALRSHPPRRRPDLPPSPERGDRSAASFPIAASPRRPQPGSRLAEGHPKGLALTPSRTPAPSGSGNGPSSEIDMGLSRPPHPRNPATPACGACSRTTLVART